MKKKLIALVAMAALLITMLPTTALAYAYDPDPDSAHISIDVIEFNNDMSRSQVIVSISGLGLSVGMPVYVVANGQAQPVYSGYIYANASQNNFYINKSDIPGIDTDAETTLTITVMNTGYTEILESQIFEKDSVPNAPTEMDASFDNFGGTASRELTVKFDSDYSKDSTDKIILQGLDAQGNEVGSATEAFVSNGSLTSKLDSNNMKTLTFSRTFSFNDKASSVRVSFARNGSVEKSLTQVIDLASPYGTLDKLVLDFGQNYIAQGGSLTGKLYYVNTSGKSYDITSETSSYTFSAPSGVLSSKSTQSTPTLSVAKDAKLGSTISVLAVCHGTPVRASLAVVSNSDPGKLKMNKTNANYGEEIGLEFTLLDASGNVKKLDFLPKNIDIQWVNSSDSTASVAVNMTDQGASLQSQGVLRVALQSNKACSGKFKITLTDASGHAYQALSDSFTFTDPKAKPDSSGAQKVTVSIGSTTMQVDGKNTTIIAPPIIDNSRTYVPLRAISQAFGANVDWNATTRVITIDLNGTKIVMEPYKTAYSVGGVSKTMDVAPYISTKYDSTMVPIRFIAEAYGFNVSVSYNSDGTTKAVTFNRK